MLTLVTGATGFIGARLATALLDRDRSVRLLVRSPDRAAPLHERGAELVQGDLGDDHALRGAVEGSDTVYHCAGVVGDWLETREAQRVNVGGTRALLSAAVDAGVRRFVFLSSLAVLGIRHHHGTDEAAPYRYTGDAYSDSKIDSERIVREFSESGRLETVILRPGFVYGPGDQQFMPRLLDSLARRRFRYIGDGSKLLNKLYVDDLIQAALLAQSHDGAAGQVYNLTDGSETSLREFVTFITEYMDLPAPGRQIPPALAWPACHGLERLARLVRSPRAPLLNRPRLKFLYYNQHFSIEKARRELGYAPQFTYREGLPPTLDWFRASGALRR